MKTLRIFSLMAISLLVISLTSVAAEAASRPNFVFILVDDLGWADLGCYGSTFYETPNVDRLAASGMRFTQAYASCPVCSPTRASIVTGKYPARTGITTYINHAGHNQPEKWRRPTLMLPARYNDRMALEEITIAEALKEGGYTTFFAGKWHMGPRGFWPHNQGFDINKGGGWKGKVYFAPYNATLRDDGTPLLEEGPPGEHMPARLAAETVKFIESHRAEPFLAYLSFWSVHTPLVAREDLKKKYEAKRQLLRNDAPRWGKERRRKVRLVQDHAVYAAMVDAMDQAVGQVLDALNRLGLEENTVVIFFSDNGGLSTSEGRPTSNLPLRAGKGWLYEGGIREPMIVRWPGVTRPDSTCDTPVISTDFYPTMLDMAGLPLRPEQHADGQSMVSLLRGEKPDQKSRPLFWHFPHYGNQGGSPAAAVRDGDWKLIEWYEDDKLELYNLAKDPGEKHDLANSKPKIRDRLHRQLNEWRKSLDVRMPTHRAKADPLRPE